MHPLHFTEGLSTSVLSSWVCLSVCVSVTLNLTSRVFVRLTKDTTYLMGNEGQFRTVFSENAPLQSWIASSIVRLMRSRSFVAAENAHAHYIRPRGGKCPFFGYEKTFSCPVSCYLHHASEWSMPTVWNYCTTKAERSCQHVFRAKRKAEHNLPDKAMKRQRILRSDSVKSAKDTLQKAS